MGERGWGKWGHVRLAQVGFFFMYIWLQTNVTRLSYASWIGSLP